MIQAKEVSQDPLGVSLRERETFFLILPASCWLVPLWAMNTWVTPGKGTDVRKDFRDPHNKSGISNSRPPHMNPNWDNSHSCKVQGSHENGILPNPNVGTPSSRYDCYCLSLYLLCAPTMHHFKCMLSHLILTTSPGGRYYPYVKGHVTKGLQSLTVCIKWKSWLTALDLEIQLKLNQIPKSMLFPLIMRNL